MTVELGCELHNIAASEIKLQWSDSYYKYLYSDLTSAIRKLSGISPRKTSTISSLYTAELVPFSNLSQTTSLYDSTSDTIQDKIADRWPHLIALRDEELIPVDMNEEQGLLDVTSSDNGSGD
ncbi:unnamed protein product, partial [Didymodactylos carnosus]